MEAGKGKQNGLPERSFRWANMEEVSLKYQYSLTFITYTEERHARFEGALQHSCVSYFSTDTPVSDKLAQM